MNKNSSLKVQNYVQQKNSVGHAVKSDPRRTHIVIEESNGDWQDKHVNDQQRENDKIPVEPKKRKRGKVTQKRMI